jgi:hypothetical protein
MGSATDEGGVGMSTHHFTVSVTELSHLSNWHTGFYLSPILLGTETRILAHSIVKMSIRLMPTDSFYRPYEIAGQATYDNIIHHIRIPCWITKAIRT